MGKIRKPNTSRRKIISRYETVSGGKGRVIRRNGVVSIQRGGKTYTVAQYKKKYHVIPNKR